MSEGKSVYVFSKVKFIVPESGPSSYIVENSQTHIPQELMLDVISSYHIIHWIWYGAV